MQNLPEEAIMFVCAEDIFRWKARQRGTQKRFGSSNICPCCVVVLHESLGVYNVFCDEARGKISK